MLLQLVICHCRYEHITLHTGIHNKGRKHNLSPVASTAQPWVMPTCVPSPVSDMAQTCAPNSSSPLQRARAATQRHTPACRCRRTSAGAAQESRHQAVLSTPPWPGNGCAPQGSKLVTFACLPPPIRLAENLSLPVCLPGPHRDVYGVLYLEDRAVCDVTVPARHQVKLPRHCQGLLREVRGWGEPRDTGSDVHGRRMLRRTAASNCDKMSEC
jgi:hypothetical protein